MQVSEIKKFLDRVLPELDDPSAYLPHINQYVTKEEQWGEDKTRMCYISPVPASASIQNLGMAILANICNTQMGENYMSTRAYHPEPKMLKKMQKEEIPFFDSCIYHQMNDYDVVGFSSYYALQYLSMIPLLQLAQIPHRSEDRINSWDYPIVGLGGIQVYSAEPVAPLFDVMFVGEGEEMNKLFLEKLRRDKKEGKSKRQFLLEAAKEIQGIYLPWAYEFTYYEPDHPTKPNQIKEYHLTDEAKAAGVPLMVLKACIEFRDTPPLTKTFVPNGEGGEMSIGSLYLCNSCSNLCSFCQGSHISLPLRERPWDIVKPKIEELTKETGSKEITPYCFNFSDLSYANRIARDVLLDQNKKVSLSSERLDMMTDDFVATTIKSGSRSFTVAVEAASPRGRHILNKHLTEEQILRAFEIMFRQGALKIKIYNIASWPFEQEEDRMYYVNLMEKIEALKAKYNSKCQMRISFTPFQSKPFTPLQWAKMENLSVDPVTDEITFLKTYNNMMEGTRKVTDSRFRFGTSSIVSLIAQALAFGDRRLFPVVEACAGNKEIPYLGGMGIGGPKAEAEFTRLMKSLTTLNWMYFAREKDEDEIFPWEMLSTGTDKSWLLSYYKKAKEASQLPIDEEGCLHLPCYQKCSVCGVCRSFERKQDNFWPEETFGVGRKLPKFQWADRESDNINVSEVLDSYTKQQQLRTLRLELDINPKFRYVDPSKFKFRLRRAFFRLDIPILNQIISASDKILEKAWFSGKDIFEVYISDKRWDMSLEDLQKALNNELSDDAFTIKRIEKYSGEIKKLRDNFEYVLYSLTLNKADYSISKVKDEITLLETAKDYPVKVKMKSKTQRDVVRVETLNAKDHLYKSFVRDNKDDTFTLFAALSNNVAMYDFATALLKTSKRNLYRFPVIVEEYLIRNTSGSMLDMFADACLECDGEIEENIFGEPISDTHCLVHKYLLDNQKRTDIEVESGLEILEDTDDDFRKSLGGHDDEDDDEDLSDKYEGNEGI